MAEVKVKKDVPQEKSVAPPTFWEGWPVLFGSMAPFASMVPFASQFFSMNPFAMLSEFSKELDRTMSGAFSVPEGTAWAPTIECKKQDGTFVVSAELPGMKKDDIEVEVTDKGLAVKGERKGEEVEEKGGTYHSERAYGRFYRFVELPEGAKAEEAKAELAEGILKITVPLAVAKPEHRRSVPIREHHSKQAA